MTSTGRLIALVFANTQISRKPRQLISEFLGLFKYQDEQATCVWQRSVRVEQAGSGKLLHGRLPLPDTVEELKKQIRKLLPPSAIKVRLFNDHTTHMVTEMPASGDLITVFPLPCWTGEVQIPGSWKRAGQQGAACMPPAVRKATAVTVMRCTRTRVMCTSLSDGTTILYPFLRENQAPVSCVAVSDHARLVVFGCKTRKAAFLACAFSGTFIRQFQANVFSRPRVGGIEDIIFLDNLHVAAIASDMECVVWNVATGRATAQFHLRCSASKLFRIEQNVVLAKTVDFRAAVAPVRAYDTKRGEQLCVKMDGLGTMRADTVVKVSADAKTLLAALNVDQTCSSLHLQRYLIVREDGRVVLSRAGRVVIVPRTGSGKWLFDVNEDGTKAVAMLMQGYGGLTTICLETGTVLQACKEIRNFRSFVVNIAFVDDNRVLLTGWKGIQQVVEVL